MGDIIIISLLPLSRASSCTVHDILCIQQCAKLQCIYNIIRIIRINGRLLVCVCVYCNIYNAITDNALVPVIYCTSIRNVQLGAFRCRPAIRSSSRPARVHAVTSQVLRATSIKNVVPVSSCTRVFKFPRHRRN